MASVNACSNRTVIRHTRQWEREGIVVITRHSPIRMCDDMERASEAERRGLFAIRLNSMPKVDDKKVKM